MASSLKKTNLKLDLFTDMGILLMIKKVSEVEYVMLFINIQKMITNILKVMMKINNHYILSIEM